MAKKAIFISFEGPEGSGKSTHIQELAHWLRAQGRKVLVTREPGGTALAKTLREFLLHTQAPVAPLAELLLYEADRAQHMAETILPALKRGETVLCDRFSDSTVAYQGYGRGLGLSLIQTLNRIASFGRKPDLTILLDVAADRGLRLASVRKRGHDRLEKAGLAFHQRVRKGFLKLATTDRRRFRVIRQQPDPAATQALVRDAVRDFITSSFPPVVRGEPRRGSPAYNRGG